jgi:histidinol phosphatase-like enzyme (inositol monophosphatase family)
MVNKELIDFANHLADLSQAIAVKYFRKNHQESTKEDDSPVTIADREIEKKLRDEIEKKYPNHSIIGEEYGIKKTNSDYCWILDPIDGTSSFIIGRPIFGTLIALSLQNQPILGIMNQPISGERWLGVKNSGAWFNNQKIKTRNCTSISDAVMCSSSSFYFQNGDEEILKKISSKTKYQKIGGVIYGGDCYSYASLASGMVDVVIDPGLKIYDYAALQPIIEEAGGVITDWNGENLNLASNVKVIASANQKLHDQMLKLINI